MDNSKFQDYVDNCNGNIYAAVNYVAKAARTRAETHNNIILHSEAISWVLTGETPQILNDIDVAQSNHSYALSYIDEVLSCVDDSDVCECVRMSLKYSKKSNHLIYVYNGVPDTERQARVRILVRMIWYHLNPHSDMY